MKQLSGLDASFLYLETAEMPMHVGALHVLELPPGFNGRFINHLRKHIASRLHALPALRRKLAWMPLNLANPAWVDAEPKIADHVVEVKLPAPKGRRTGGGMPELEALVAELHMQLLDRSRPLWKFHVIEGLAPDAQGRKRVAMYTQLHHAAVDGQAAVALAATLFDVTEAPRAIEKRPSTRTPKFQLGMAEMLSGAVANQVQQLTQLVRALPATVGTLSHAATETVGRSRLATGRKEAEGRLTLAPRTVLNASVTAGRAFASVSVPLQELKGLGRAHEATINDVVLWLCSTALRRYFGKHGPLPRASLIAAVPISLRAKGDTTADNQASITLVSLGTNLADPSRRLAHIKAATASMKATVANVRNILPTDFPSMGVPWLMEAAAKLIGRTRAAERVPAVANLAISNVPGPAMPLYLARARMLSNHPTSIVLHGIALNITVQSYDQHMDFGLMACAKAMPHVRELAQGIAVAFEDLRSLPVADTADAAQAAADLASVPRKAGAVAKKVLKNAIGQAVKTAGRAVPQPVNRAARKARSALNGKTAEVVASVVPALAREAVSRSLGAGSGRKTASRSR